MESEGVAAIEDRAKEDQIGKIRDMGDDEFTAYKDERAELRKSVVAELESLLTSILAALDIVHSQMYNLFFSSPGKLGKISLVTIIAA